MDRKYTIVTGYHAAIGESYKSDFFKLWWANTHKYANPLDVFVVNVNSKEFPEEKLGKWIDFKFNLGHAHDLDVNDYPHKKIGGWSMCFMLGCLLAYSNDSDLIFKEQDALCFGNWVERLYEDAKEQKISAVVGRKQDSINQALEQSCFLVKHELLLPFMTAYTNVPRNDGGPGFLRTEGKFQWVMDHDLPGKIGFTKMGYGRARPKEWNKDEPFYIQKVQAKEMTELAELGLIDLEAPVGIDNSKRWEH